MAHAPNRNLHWLLAILLTGQFMANVDVAIVNIAGPSIRAGLHATGSELELIVSGYLLTYAMLLVTGARLGATHGHRRVFLGGLALFTAASLACGLVPGPIPLIVARIAQGAGAALLVPQVLSGIQLNFEGPARARALGFYAMALSGGAVAGQVLGGVIVSANIAGLGWRPVFLINIPIGIALLAAGLRFLPADGRRTDRPLDLPGVATLSTATLLAVLPLILGREQGWPAWTWVSMAASLPVLAVFVALERRLTRRGGFPLLNLHVLVQPVVARGLVAIAAATTTYFGLLFVLALYLQQGLGWSPLASGLAMVSWVTAFGVAGPAFARIPADAARRVTAAGPLVLAAVYLAITGITLTGLGGGALLVVLLGFGGLGLGTNYSGLVGRLTTAVGPRYAADLSGALPTTSQMSAAVGVAAFGTLYLALGGHPAPQAFAVVTAAMGAVALVATVACYLATRPTSQPIPAVDVSPAAERSDSVRPAA